MNNGGNTVPRITNAEHIGPNDTGDNIEAKRVAGYVWNPNTSEWERMTQPSITTGSVTIDGVAAFSDASDIDKKGLVDADRHVQVDVLTMPSVSIDTTGLATSSNQTTTNTKLDTIITNQLPDGHNVTVDNASIAVTAAALPLPSGAATAANQQTDALTDTELRATPVPVSGTVSTGLSQPLTDAQLRASDVPVTLGGESVAVTGTFWQATQPVSGTVTANLSATDNAVLDDIAANQTDNSQKTQIVDAAGNAVTVTGNKLDVNASVSTTGLATDTKQDAQTALLTTIDADTSVLAATDFATEAKQDAIITAIGAIPGGGGVQYDDGDARGAATGTLALGDDGTNLQSLHVDSSGNLQVDILSGTQTDALTDTELRAAPVIVDLGANNDVTVTSGSITANAGTNLNTSALALESGGVLDTIKADTEAIETAVEALQAGQLPDGHNVTVDNASLAVTGTFWQATQPVSATDLDIRNLTATDVVTANLSATDNAVLDTISTNTLNRGDTSTVTSVSGSASSVELLAANAARVEATITNDSTADLYIKLGTTASTTSYTVKLGTDESYIVDKYVGKIDGIWSSATGNARITEVDN